MKGQLRNRKGYSVVILFFLIVAISFGVIPILINMRDIFNVSVDQREKEKAFFLADSGIKYFVKYQLEGNSNWSKDKYNPAIGIPTITKNFANGSFTVGPKQGSAPSTGSITLQSVGSVLVGTTVFSRTLEQTITGQAPFQYAAFSDGNLVLSMSGQARTDSYDSSIGRYNVNGNIGENGDVGTNGDISMSGQAHIGGDASTGPSGTFNDQGRVSGDISHGNNTTLGLITVPASLVSLPNEGTISSAQTINGGDHKYTSINLSGQNILTIVGPSNIYLTGSSAISMSGQAKVDVSSSSTGSVIMYVDHNVDASGQGLMNSTYIPSNFQLYGTGTNQTINLSGQGDMYGAVYAPNASITLSGQGALYGSFIGDRLTMSGQGGIHFDEALQSITLPGGGTSAPLSFKDWKEI